MADAFGGPGFTPTWSSSAKDLVCTSLGSARVWVTLGHGVLNEVYWPSTGEPQVRDLGFIVTDPTGWSEVKRTAAYDLATPAPDVPVPRVVHRGAGWTLTLEVVVDPDRDVVLVHHQLQGTATGLYVLVAPHLGAGTSTVTAWVDGDGLVADADAAEAALCLVASGGFARSSVGYVGASDGWQDFDRNGAMTWTFDRAATGNVALLGELRAHDGTLALGLAPTVSGAGILARSALTVPFEATRDRVVADWRAWADGLRHIDADDDLARRSAAVIRCHEDRTYPGAIVASLSVPWGNDRGDLGGYHLVWSRDLVESALALVASGQLDDACRTLGWLIASQQPDGHWSQNAYPDGRPFWVGIQLDEVALPIVLATVLDDRGHPRLPGTEAMVADAARFIAANGPSSAEDRWEENAGLSAFTLAAEVAGLVAAARWLPPDDARYALSLADHWQERVEEWLYVAGGPLAEGRDVRGYYVRLGLSDGADGMRGQVDVRNTAGVRVEADTLVALDFLALARFGLRSADDPRMLDTVRVVDDLLAVRLPTGTAYRRYNGDGYGEHDDGAPFDGTGVGRPWPLLAGERGHFAFQRGEPVEPFLASMRAMCGPGGLLPEQVWDGPPIPERFLEPGRPTGSAMPLVWAHGEYIKLATLAARGVPIEQLPEVRTRYCGTSPASMWHVRRGVSGPAVAPDRDLLVDHGVPFTVDVEGTTLASDALGLGRHGVRLPAGRLPAGVTSTLHVHVPDGDSFDLPVTIGPAAGRP